MNGETRVLEVTSIMTRARLAAAFAALALLGGVAGAHHSHAVFDMSKRVSISGTVEKFEFTNPHSWLKVVNAADGALWAFETNSPSQLARKGIKVSAFPAGMKVTVVAAPMRDGRPGGQIFSVTRADGTVVNIVPEAPPGGAGR